MKPLRSAYRLLVRRLPPRAAWALWRAALAVTPARRRRVPGPQIAVASVAWGIDEEALAVLIDELAARTGVPGPDLLVISDCDAVHVAAARGCRLEYLPPAGDWERRFARPYDELLEARGRGIRAAYRIARVEAPAEAPRALRRGLGSELPAL